MLYLHNVRNMSFCHEFVTQNPHPVSWGKRAMELLNGIKLTNFITTLILLFYVINIF